MAIYLIDYENTKNLIGINNLTAIVSSNVKFILMQKVYNNERL